VVDRQEILLLSQGRDLRHWWVVRPCSAPQM
jgi:hypothetical protein